MTGSVGEWAIAILKIVGMCLFVFFAFVGTDRLLNRVLREPVGDSAPGATAGAQAVPDAVRIARARLDSGEITQEEFEDIRRTLGG